VSPWSHCLTGCPRIGVLVHFRVISPLISTPKFSDFVFSDNLLRELQKRRLLYGIFEAKQLLVMIGYQNTYSVDIPVIYHVVLMLLKTKRVKLLTD
jgi:hypothetical protein